MSDSSRRVYHSSVSSGRLSTKSFSTCARNSGSDTVLLAAKKVELAK